MIKPAYSMAMAAGTDAANRNMKKNGRSRWNKEDRRAAQRVFQLLVGKASAQ